MEFILRRERLPSYTAVMCRVFPLLLIIALLICPYRCQGSWGSGCAAESAQSACACCKHCATTDGVAAPNTATAPEDRPAPLSDDDDCFCGSCLCHGAISEESDLVLDQLSFVDTLFVPVGTSLETLSNRIGRNDRPPLFGAPVGRCLRLSLHSLQI